MTGVQAFDNEDGVLIPQVSILDTTILIVGQHTVVYTVTDTDGNRVTATRTIIVLENEAIDPEDPVEPEEPTDQEDPVVPEDPVDQEQPDPPVEIETP